MGDPGLIPGVGRALGGGNSNPLQYSHLHEQRSLAGKEEKGATEDGMVEWHHQLNGHESEQVLRDREGQGSLACYRGLKE